MKHTVSNDAAINVCYVVLFVGGDFDERFVYPHQQHAGMGTNNNDIQSFEVFYGGDANDISEGEWFL